MRPIHPLTGSVGDGTRDEGSGGAVIYLSGAENRGLRGLAEQGYPVGLMAQPDSGIAHHARHYPAWAADNGCFARGAAFDLGRFLAWLAGLTARETCLFAVAPDVYGDGPATLRRAAPALPQIRALGFPAALVAQPGIVAGDLPWGSFDALFVGGPDEWQMSSTVDALVGAARARGLHCHRGRVNSGKRLRASAVRGFDSADGTYLAFGPEVNVPRLARWLDDLARQPALPLLGA